MQSALVASLLYWTAAPKWWWLRVVAAAQPVSFAVAMHHCIAS